MLFNSEIFLFLFLPSVLALYFFTRQVSSRLSLLTLLLGSLFFYGYWNPYYLILLTFSVLFNYAIYKLIVARVVNFWGCAFGVSVNILIIAYFKYFGFILSDAFGVDLVKAGIETPVLPLAISFFTFQQISFVVDAYKSREKEARDLLDYACYVTFFPQLIAGPIVRHNELIPQLVSNSPTKQFLVGGFFLFGIGLFKKVVIADSISVWVNLGFENYTELTVSDSWLTALSYTFQLYFDFSGYSDMAIGLAMMFGFKLPINFNSPYKSKSIREFWRRWHVTLSRWLRDYVYIPLGGSRQGANKTYLNLLLTMLLGGLWHGAAWTFVVWGGLHGLALMINKAWSGFKIEIPVVISWGLTILFVVVGWVVFRAETFEQAAQILGTMFVLDGVTLANSSAEIINEISRFYGVGEFSFESKSSIIPTQAWIAILFLLVVVCKAPNSMELLEEVRSARGWKQTVYLFGGGVILALAVKRLMETSVQSEFLYFQF